MLLEVPNSSVSRTAPSPTLHMAFGVSPSAEATSVEPPPMSMQSERALGGFPQSTPRVMRRASSTPEMTSSRSPASSRARRTISSRFFASRTALVATARTCAW